MNRRPSDGAAFGVAFAPDASIDAFDDERSGGGGGAGGDVDEGVGVALSVTVAAPYSDDRRRWYQRRSSRRAVMGLCYAVAMPPYAHLDPGAFAIGDGADVGVLMLHGFSGTPTELRELGEALGAHGMMVRAPLLPGHGTHHRDLEVSTRAQWLAAAAAAFDDLAAHARRVVIVGQSMGALLALHLASERPIGAVAAVVALAPALRLRLVAQLTRLPLPLRYVPKYEERLPDLVDKAQVRGLWSNSHTPVRAVPQVLALGRETATRLSALRAPLLVVQGAKDRTVLPQGAHEVLALSGSQHKELLWLEKTGHIVAVDGERDVVIDKTLGFLERFV